MIKQKLKKIFFLIFAIITCLFFDISDLNQGLSYDQKMVIRMVLLMIFLWLTEIIPISVTALIPILFAPVFDEVKFLDITRHYSSPVVFLLLGGFIIAQGFEKSGLHQRIALKTLLNFGDSREKILISVIFSTAFFSMWLSNTATCLLMLPIVSNILENKFKKPEDKTFSKILILSIAYASSVGGMATPIGTIPNAVMVSFLNENYGIEIDFINWFVFTFPLVLSLLVFMSFFLKSKFKEGKKKIDKKFIQKKYLSLGRISEPEKISIFILFLTISLWIFKRYINKFFEISLTDASIAIFGSLLFFILPLKGSSSILRFDWYKKIPWNVLVLFGGGLSMASLIMTTGLADEISKLMDMINIFSLFTIIILIALITSLMTEFTSNTATTFLLLPLLSIFAINNDLNILQLTFPFVLAASCAFMMPIATPPNAIVYSSNKFNITFMVKNGFLINIISVIIISNYVFFLRYN